jgi:hypothetical protein
MHGRVSGSAHVFVHRCYNPHPEQLCHTRGFGNIELSVVYFPCYKRSLSLQVCYVTPAPNLETMKMKKLLGQPGLLETGCILP